MYRVLKDRNFKRYFLACVWCLALGERLEGEVSDDLAFTTRVARGAGPIVKVLAVMTAEVMEDAITAKRYCLETDGPKNARRLRLLHWMHYVNHSVNGFTTNIHLRK